MKVYKVKVNGKVYEVEVEAIEEVKGSVEAPEETKPVKEPAVQGSNEILSPIAGKVLDIRVSTGDFVKKNQVVAVIEAMKLENEIQSAYDGKVKQIVVSKGDDVRNKDVLIILE